MPCNRNYSSRHNLERHHKNIHGLGQCDQAIVDNTGLAAIYTLPPLPFWPPHPVARGTPQPGIPAPVRGDRDQEGPQPGTQLNRPLSVSLPHPIDVPPVKRPRLEGSREKQHVPTYVPELSKKNGKVVEPREMKGIGWVSAAAKAHFEERHEELLARWGRTTSDGNACLLLPADWNSLEPLEIIELLKTKKFPGGSESRIKYSYQDYNTQHSRALAWFGEWPRSGAQLDNLVGAKEYKPMDGSHLCHYGNCVLHCVYETIEENEDRKWCYSLAKQLRKEGKHVPAHCQRHERPCLLVNASLSTEEAYRLQFSIYCEAMRLPPMDTPRRPPWHATMASAFEWRLPLSFSDSIVFHAHTLEPLVKKARNPGQPALMCDFCEKITSYSTIAHLWAHFYHFYQGIDQSSRLNAITCTASQWRSYLQSRKLRGQDQQTLERIKQTQQEDFSWEVVENWKLR